jgi:hypothetical protein
VAPVSPLLLNYSDSAVSMLLAQARTDLSYETCGPQIAAAGEAIPTCLSCVWE